MTTMTTQTIGTSDFVRRQTPESKFSHFKGTWSELEELVRKNMDRRPRVIGEGIWAVTVPPEEFFSGVVALSTGDNVQATYAPRTEGEEPFIETSTTSRKKCSAKSCDIIVYRHDVLGAEASTKCDWEIVSVNASATARPTPPTPVAMARNMLNLPGGTAATYTAEEFCESIYFWSTHAMCG